MEWADILEDQALQDLPYKIELNREGQIVMSPATNLHGCRQFDIAQMMANLIRGGRIHLECSILTSDNVKVADVAWASDDFMKKNHAQTPYTVAPEICVEVKSPGNSYAQIAKKRDLYLAKGAKEVWICDENGAMTFYDFSGELKKSVMVKKFPKKI